MTPAPVVATTWRDAKVEFGAVRCYVIRTVVTLGSAVESEPSPACVSPTDTFPPKAPTSLAAVASQGAISLIWEANTEPDLAGYIVLRGSASGATMRPLMTAPIKETTFRDTTVRPSARYVYASWRWTRRRRRTSRRSRTGWRRRRGECLQTARHGADRAACTDVTQGAQTCVLQSDREN